jgi:arginine/lysine/ornithine decarboxylase
MADAKKVLFVFSLGTGREHCEVLFHFLSRLDKVVPGFSSRQPYVDRIHFQYDQPEVSFDEIRRGKQHMVSLGEAVDRTVAEMIIPYPPGIPFLLPGEIFTSEKKRVIEMALESGNKVRGITYKSSTPCVCVLQ